MASVDGASYSTLRVEIKRFNHHKGHEGSRRKSCHDFITFVVAAMAGYTSGHSHETNLFCILALALLEAGSWQAISAQTSNPADMATAQEKHLRNVHQLTFGGQNAEAYFSADGKKLIYQSSHGDVKCDQIFRHEYRRHGPAHGLDRQGTHDLQFLLSRRQEDSLRVDASGEPGVSAAAGLLEGLRVGRVFGI